MTERLDDDGDLNLENTQNLTLERISRQLLNQQASSSQNGQNPFINNQMSHRRMALIEQEFHHSKKEDRNFF